MSDTTTQVEVTVFGQTQTVEFPAGSTAQTIYNYVEEKTKLGMNQVRVVVDAETVEPEEASKVTLRTGSLVDIVPEISNG